MGIVVPRPAIRRRESRLVSQQLQRHARVMTLLTEAGMDRTAASRIALDIIRAKKGATR